MIKIFKKEKILVFVLIFAGLLSLLINLSINYEISLSQKNKKAYETIEKLSKYPKPLLIFANKNFETLNETDLIETQTWLDENNVFRAASRAVYKEFQSLKSFVDGLPKILCRRPSQNNLSMALPKSLVQGP